MVDGRQERVGRLAEAYKGYFAQLGTFGSNRGDPTALDFVAFDNKTRSELALKLALVEIVRPV